MIDGNVSLWKHNFGFYYKIIFERSYNMPFFRVGGVENHKIKKLPPNTIFVHI